MAFRNTRSRSIFSQRDSDPIKLIASHENGQDDRQPEYTIKDLQKDIAAGGGFVLGGGIAIILTIFIIAHHTMPHDEVIKFLKEHENTINSIGTLAIAGGYALLLGSIPLMSEWFFTPDFNNAEPPCPHADVPRFR